MKITVFTSNQPRHINLINRLSSVADEVYAIQECNTIFPGKIKDFFNNSPIMQEYFKKMMLSEKNIFGNVRFLPCNVRQLAIKSGDLNNIDMNTLNEALKSDIYVVFGSSFIKGNLIEFLIEKRAFNIHMGVSPYFRGSSCNFWAAYTENIDLVGATVHMLSKKLDAGDMLYHVLPKAEKIEAFDLGMKAVKIAHDSLADRIKNGNIFEYEPVKQDKSLEIKYTVNSDFTDEVAKDYLENLPNSEYIFEKLSGRDLNLLLRPYIA